MKTKLNPAIVGMFILGALLLFIVGFLSFGGSNVFRQPTRFLVYFDESVSGLEPGAPIKFYGVRIGRVAAIGHVRYDSVSRRALVQTVCEINRNVLTDREGVEIDLNNREQLQSLIERGMRAKLQFTGITGLLFVELSFEEPEKYPVGKLPGEEALPVVPAIPSPIAEVQQSVIEIVANIKQVDFAKLSRELQALLASANSKIDELDLKKLSERLTHTADAVSALVESPETKQAFANLNLTLVEARAAIAKLDAGAGPVADEMKKTLTEAQLAMQALTGAAETTKQFVAAQGNVGEELTLSLRQISDAAAALERLADSIRRNPSALVVGKKKTE